MIRKRCSTTARIPACRRLQSACSAGRSSPFLCLKGNAHTGSPFRRSISRLRSLRVQARSPRTTCSSMQAAHGQRGDFGALGAHAPIVGGDDFLPQIYGIGSHPPLIPPIGASSRYPSENCSNQARKYPPGIYGPLPGPVHTRPGLTRLVAAPGHPCPGLTQPINRPGK
jgi:hypothetical protein